MSTVLELSSLYSIPQMPLHEIDPAALLQYTVAMGALTVSLLLWWALSSERSQYGFVLPLALLGGALAGFIEPIIDVLALVWYPQADYLVVFSAFGRDIPWLVPLGYAWYVGGLPYIVFRLLNNGVHGASTWWKIFVGIMLIDCAAISAVALMNVAGFYGNQPFDLWGFPLWWAAIDGPQPLVGGLLMYYLLPRLEKLWQRSVVVVLAPIVSMAAMVGIAMWPVAIALNTHQAPLMMHIGGAATFGLGCLVAWFCIFVITRSSK